MAAYVSRAVVTEHQQDHVFVQSKNPIVRCRRQGRSAVAADDIRDARCGVILFDTCVPCGCFNGSGTLGRHLFFPLGTVVLLHEFNNLPSRRKGWVCGLVCAKKPTLGPSEISERRSHGKRAREPRWCSVRALRTAIGPEFFAKLSCLALACPVRRGRRKRTTGALTRKAAFAVVLAFAMAVHGVVLPPERLCELRSSGQPGRRGKGPDIEARGCLKKWDIADRTHGVASDMDVARGGNCRCREAFSEVCQRQASQYVGELPPPAIWLAAIGNADRTSARCYHI